MGSLEGMLLGIEVISVEGKEDDSKLGIDVYTSLGPELGCSEGISLRRGRDTLHPTEEGQNWIWLIPLHPALKESKQL